MTHRLYRRPGRRVRYGYPRRRKVAVTLSRAIRFRCGLCRFTVKAHGQDEDGALADLDQHISIRHP